MDSIAVAGGELHPRIRQQGIVAGMGRRALESDDLDQPTREASVAAVELLGTTYANLDESLLGTEGVAGIEDVRHGTRLRQIFQNFRRYLIGCAIDTGPMGQDRTFEAFQRPFASDELRERIVERCDGERETPSKPGEGAMFSVVVLAADATGSDRDA